VSISRRKDETDLISFNSPEGVRVLIVEDHRLFAEAIRWILQQWGMDVVGVTTGGEEAIEIARLEKPDLILLDLNLGGKSGMFVGKQILEVLPDSKVVAVTTEVSPRVVKEAMRAGFHGFVTMDTPMEQFASSIMTVLAGQVVLPRQLARVTSGILPPEEKAALALTDQLSQRERQILALFVDGLNNSQIAKRLGIAQNTVRAHAQSVLTKLQVHSRLEAAAFAVRYRILRPTDWPE
jgi:two-component system, NarL family, nitrate/nitrite response regulator NarL